MMLGVDVVVCDMCEVLMDKRHKASVVETDSGFIYIGYLYTCPKCGHHIIAHFSGSPIFPSVDDYINIRQECYTVIK